MHLKKLTIVSDTPIYKYQGGYFAFGPVVREIEFVENLFGEITWIGFNSVDKLNDLSMQKIKSKKIKVVLLKSVGGKDILSFLKIILRYPIMFFVIIGHIFKADIVHTRAPSHPALIAVLISFFFRKKIWWNKFAGNWKQVNPPLSYGFQRFIFKKASFSNVTVNGFWDDQPAHCLSFENPCLTLEDITRGLRISKEKEFNPPFVFSFVGRLETPKGVERIIEALKKVSCEKIAEVHFIGDGYKMDFYKEKASFLKEKVCFHGFLDKEGVHKVLAQSHFILLPSDSEGFPKVIAEAACYGVVPVVSNVGSIGHYIDDANGFVWDSNFDVSYEELLSKALNSDASQLKEISDAVLELAEKFTFTNYISKLKLSVLQSIR